MPALLSCRTELLVAALWAAGAALSALALLRAGGAASAARTAQELLLQAELGRAVQQLQQRYGHNNNMDNHNNNANKSFHIPTTTFMTSCHCSIVDRYT